jgi:1,4-dihydroxy-2-naphthoate octaprenyltransferase
VAASGTKTYQQNFRIVLRSTIRLLRFHFSLFLMPVYWFALSQVVNKDWPRAVLIFIILHLLLYPSSNGYNSYMDRDQGSIGGIRQPPSPTRQLYLVTLEMDIAAILAGLLVSVYFAAGIFIYILASRAYSYRGIRLKKYPFFGYATVVVCQGALVFFLVYHGSHEPPTLSIPVGGMVASSLLLAGFYPLTQIYQHEADRLDGVTTISYILGYRGTFVFCLAMYAMAFAALAYFMFSSLEIREFFALATCMLPIAVYFFIWAAKVWKDTGQANYQNTMRMNIIASFCTNLGFIVVLLMQ